MAKVILVVMDSVGVGALPDAGLYGDAGSNTLGHICERKKGIKLFNLASLGLGKIVPLEGVPAVEPARGCYGKMAEMSCGKDTTTGHWEIAGIITEDPMPTFPYGFPPQLIEVFEKRIGRKTLGNVAASGTEIIEELGEEHMRTGYPIVYTSADSVFQVAAHEEVISLEEIYQICKTARELLTGPWAVGRVIARPFVGKPGSFARTANRHDYSLAPSRPTVLDSLKEKGYEVIGVGKIGDIFAGCGLTGSIPTRSNEEGIRRIKEAWQGLKDGMVFANLVEFDSAYGHRNDVDGYAGALEDFDRHVPDLMELVERGGLLIITADHGNDPTTLSTDHSREYVPLLVYGREVKAGVDLGIRKTFADIAATISELYQLPFKCRGESFLSLVKKQGKEE
ncbi:MAG: phosphopentomutase [Peptococcaceae bacterium]|jgi:phosphopentomutase|nr:phosphopentomutase [Peptococcaceae bacterium]MDH7525314.1 phosphopentomutase [Peptococcaceae bacterium]